MARIRTLKPEHRQHRKTGALSHITYRLWVGMILEADDEGRLVCDADQLRVTIFGYHPNVRRAIVEGSLKELDDHHLVRLYIVEGVRYAWFPSWHDHQRIDRPQPSKLPPYDDSSNLRRTLDEHSSLIGREGKGSEGNLSCGAPAPRLELEILDWLNQKSGKTFRSVGTNLDLIRARLKDGITAYQLKAIVSIKADAWRGTDMAAYLRPTTLFNKTKCEQYVGELRAPRPADA